MRDNHFGARETKKKEALIDCTTEIRKRKERERERKWARGGLNLRLGHRFPSRLGHMPERRVICLLLGV